MNASPQALSSVADHDWRAMAASLSLPARPFVNGDYADALTDDTIETTNPADGSPLAVLPDCGQADVDRAVAAARSAFETGPWARMAATERKLVMFRWADALERRSTEIALIEALNMGKPIRFAYGLDVPKAIKAIRWYAEIIDKLYDEIAPTRRDALALVTREPVGVVAAVIAWNYPFYMACYKIAPAIALRNSVVLKPSELTPHSALIMAEAAAEAGIPPGVLNVVTGRGETAGQALGRHEDVDALTFTGSTAVGKRFLVYAGESNMKRVTLECGGKSPQLVLTDCPDLATVAQATAMGIFYNQGEVCNACSRLIVEEPVRDALLEQIAHAARDFAPGDPLDPACQMGPIVSRPQHERILRYIATGAREGATLRLGGKAALEDSGGRYVEPTIFDDVTNDMIIARDEIFGPVLSVIPCASAEEGVALANDSPYGLAASVWTRDITKAHTIARRLRAGSVWVNSYNTSDMSTPFGGFKQSGYGKDKAHHALEKFCEYKNTWIELSN